jgi:hypothetical protein
MRQWVVVTQDCSGLGWTKRLLEDGESVVFAKQIAEDDKDPDEFALVGEGLVDCEPLETAIATRKGPQTYWVFDRNCFADQADALRAAGQKVFGTSALSARMELDRAYGCEVASACGLPSPPTREFDSNTAGCDWLERNPTIAYVCKPNASDNNYSTFVPFRENAEDANHELLCYLRNAPEAKSGFILQERKPGVEANVEVWLQNGVPFFAMVCLENKRRWDHDLGEMSGCAGDIVFPIPLDTPIIAATIGKMLPFYEQQGYTGFADVNVILGDNQVWFLEVCNRFGYSSHPNLFLNCALDSFGNIMADFMDGQVETIASRFRSGFGASVTLFIDHKRTGLPLTAAPRSARSFYPFDGFRPASDVLLTGYSHEVGIFCDHDYTIEEAAESCLSQLLHREAVTYPDIAFRTDLHKADYVGAPVKRYSALRSMRLL